MADSHRKRPSARPVVTIPPDEKACGEAGVAPQNDGRPLDAAALPTRPLSRAPVWLARPGRPSPRQRLSDSEARTVPDPVDVERDLECAECGRLSEPGASGWRAYLDDDGQAVMFCPECAEREFGDSVSRVGRREFDARAKPQDLPGGRAHPGDRRRRPRTAAV